MNTNLGIEPGQVWEGRTRRRDGSRERLTVLEVDGRAALCQSANPGKGKPGRRRVGILNSNGLPLLGNLRLIQTADGRPVRFGPDGALAEPKRDLEGVAGIEALAAELGREG